MRGIKSVFCGICGNRKKVYSSGRTRCRGCENKQRRAWRAANPELAKRTGREQQRRRRKRNPRRIRDEQWAMMLQRKYGLSVLQYHDLFERQSGACAICRSPDPHHASGRMVVDHDHGNGRIRGLLCGWCNSAIGYLGDNPVVAARVIEYLRKGGADAGSS